MKKKILAVIPARQGSKRIPQKNMRLLNNKPLIYYSILAAMKSKMITDTVVSTDSHKIFKYAKRFKKIYVPFLRPAKLSGDNIETCPVIKHAIIEMEKIKNTTYDLIILLQPTCPLRTYHDIDQSIKIYDKNKADSVISIVSVGPNHPFRMKKIKNNGRLINFLPKSSEENMKPIQKLPTVYIRNGAIYLSTRNQIITKNSLVGKKVFPYIMTEERSVNIDTFEDLFLARKKINNIKSRI